MQISYLTRRLSRLITFKNAKSSKKASTKTPSAVKDETKTKLSKKKETEEKTVQPLTVAKKEIKESKKEKSTKKQQVAEVVEVKPSKKKPVKKEKTTKPKSKVESDSDVAEKKKKTLANKKVEFVKADSSDSSSESETQEKPVAKSIISSDDSSEDSSEESSDNSSDESSKEESKKAEIVKPDSSDLNSDEESEESSDVVVAEYTEKVLKSSKQTAEQTSSSDSDSDDSDSSSSDEEDAKKKEEDDSDSDSDSDSDEEEEKSNVKKSSDSSDSSDSEAISVKKVSSEESNDVDMTEVKKESPLGTGVIVKEWKCDFKYLPDQGYAPSIQLTYSSTDEMLKELSKTQAIEYDSEYIRIIEPSSDGAQLQKKRICLSDTPSSKKQNVGADSNLEVFVGGFPFGSTESEIKALFEESCGPVSRVKVLGQGGAAFIQFFKKEGVDAALQWDQTEYKGRKLNINLSSDRANKPAPGASRQGAGSDIPDATVIVRNVPFAVSEDDIHSFFSNISEGSVQSVRIPTYQDTGKIRGFAMVSFSSAQAAKAALENSGSDLLGRTVQIEIARPREQSMGPRGDNRGNNRGNFNNRNNRNSHGGGKPFNQKRQSTGSHQIFDE